VARIMKKANIRSKIARKYVVTTDSKHKYPVVGNYLDRNFHPAELAKVWVSDITYIRTQQGWLYLTVILDLGDRKVIGWSLSQGLTARQTSISAWRMAIKNRPVTRNLIFHSDRGVQYACHEFADLLIANKYITRSMSRKGNCWDNAVAESFFKTLKTEWVNRFKYTGRDQAAVSIFDYIETWYNKHRKHSALGYLSPCEYEQIFNDIKNVA
jgi:transposase InsO family protein